MIVPVFLVVVGIFSVYCGDRMTVNGLKKVGHAISRPFHHGKPTKAPAATP